MKYKAFNYVILVVLLSVCWRFFNSNNLEAFDYLTRSNLSDLHGSLQGYFSVRFYNFIYPILFLLFAPYLLNKQKETPAYISRYGSRRTILWFRIKNLMIYSFLFAVIQVGMDVVSIFCFFDMPVKLNQPFLFISTVQLIYVFIYFLIIGMIYTIFNDIFFIGFIAQLITLFIITFQQVLHMKNIWTPVNELIKYDVYFSQGLRTSYILSGLSAYMFLLAILIVVGQEVLKKRDFINGE